MASNTRCSWGAGAALLIAACSGSAPSREVQELIGKHDVAYERTETYTVERDGRGGFRLSSETEVSTLFLSERAAESPSRQIAEQYFAPVEELRAFLDGDSLPGSRIIKVMPDRGDAFLHDLQVHAIDYRGVRPGQRATYRYRQRYAELAYMPLIAVPEIDHVKRYSVVVEHPAGVRVDFELFFPRERLAPIIERTPTRTSLELRDLRHVEPLSSFPYNDEAAVIWPQLSEGGRRLNPVRAEEFTRWYLQKLADLPPPSAENRRVVQGLVAGAATPRDKLKAIYDYVRRNIRYIADERNINSIVPRAPALVLERRYGDCKDKAFLVAQLGRTVGLNVEMVLIGTEPHVELDGIHRAMFNHMIAAFSDGGRRLFLDPTCMPCELGNLPEMDVDGQALVLDPRAPEKLLVPPPEQQPSVELEIEASADALAGAAARIVLRNDALRHAAELRRTAAPDALQRELSRDLGAHLTGILLRQFRFEAVHEDHAVLAAAADLSRFVIRSPTRLYLPQTPFRVVDKELLDRAGDPHLVYLTRRDHLQLRIRLRAAGHSIAAPVDERWGDPEVAQFATRLEAEPSPAGPADRFVASYSYRERPKRFVGSARASYLALCRRYLQAGRAMHVLVRGR